MVKFLNEECRSEKNPMNKYHKKQKETKAPERYFEICRDGQDTPGESGKMKNLLRRTVEKEFAPQSLIDSIRQGIRREI